MKKRNIQTLPFSSQQIQKLQAGGYMVTEDLEGKNASNLVKELNILPIEAADIIRTFEKVTKKKPLLSQSVTALQLLQEESQQDKIVMFSEALDQMIGGGISYGKITEFCGSPGSGKTQLCMQIAANATIPEVFGGVEGESLYIDTEGSFSMQRLRQISAASERHCRDVSRANQDPEQIAIAEAYNVDKIIAAVHYSRCHQYAQLIATINMLDQFLKKHRKVKVIIIDSIAFLFRHEFQCLGQRLRILNSMAQTLLKYAHAHKLAIVLVNQMTTRVERGRSELIPALGESWAHTPTIRIILNFDGQSRTAALVKSPSDPKKVVPYQITANGIRDVDEVSSAASSAPPEKRCKQSVAGQND